jgi:hypothetical protein
VSTTRDEKAVKESFLHVAAKLSLMQIHFLKVFPAIPGALLVMIFLLALSAVQLLVKTPTTSAKK